MYYIVPNVLYSTKCTIYYIARCTWYIGMMYYRPIVVAPPPPPPPPPRDGALVLSAGVCLVGRNIPFRQEFTFSAGIYLVGRN